jgi:macrolide transport system ATP-binding/permease protein
MELIRLENITKTYHLGSVDVPVLRGISLSIARGEMVALMGVSGSGKTTLMNILGCLDRPSAGRYWLDGQEMSNLTPNQRALVRTARLGFVFQSFNLLPRTTATQNVLMPLSYAPHHPGGAESRQRAEGLLELVGLADRCDHEPSQMSGGQQQRVAIARALVNRPDLILADEPTGNLDSHTSVEILRMFQELNTEGITVVLVTHDANVAAYAHRTIRISDGLIEADEPSAIPLHSAHSAWTAVAAARAGGNGNGNGGAATTATSLEAKSAVAVAESGAAASIAIAAQPESAPQGAKPKSRHAGSAAFVPSTLRTAMGALRRNKMRSVLTGLGVIIGVGAVIAMTEIGEGSRAALEKTIASMGANNLLILPGAAMTGSVSFGVGTAQTLKPSDMTEILSQCPAVCEVAPIVGARTQVVYGNRNWIPRNITGTTPSYLAIREWQVDEGDTFTEHDVHNGNRVCLIGATLKHELFQDESPIGKEVRIQNVSFRVIGVLGSKGANMMGQDQDDALLAPWTAIKFRVNGGGAGSTIGSSQTITVSVNSLSNLYPGGTTRYPVALAAQTADMPQPIRFVNVDALMAKAASAEQLPEAIDQITSLLRERHRLPADRGNDFEIRDMSEITRMIAQATGLVSALLLMVAAISLVVGGVGIMNIMLVSVTERTREIGLRMAVGARSYHILQQFLVEAVVLCLAGGAVGIAMGRGVSILVRSIKGWTTSVSIPAILVAVLVSVGVGVIFGFYPAWKASRLDPIEALRYE